MQQDSDLTLLDLDDVDVSVIDDEGSLHGPVLSEPTVTLQDSTAGSIPSPASGMDMSFFLLLSMLQQGGRRGGGGGSGGGGSKNAKSTLDSYTTSKQNVEHNLQTMTNNAMIKYGIPIQLVGADSEKIKQFINLRDRELASRQHLYK